uniref:Uncharacterized protein n=1 Tax=Oryza rufipogon TaxID=4529 RepID=A0A0E0R8A9_ORYRU
MATVEYVDIQAVASVQLGIGKAATRLGMGTGMAAAPTWLGQVGMFSYVDADGVAGATVCQPRR